MGQLWHRERSKVRRPSKNSKTFFFFFKIACDFMWSDSWFWILPSPPPYLVSPQSYYPPTLDCSCRPGNSVVHVDFFFYFLIVLRQRKLEMTHIKVKAMQRDAVSLSLSLFPESEPPPATCFSYFLCQTMQRKRGIRFAS